MTERKGLFIVKCSVSGYRYLGLFHDCISKDSYFVLAYQSGGIFIKDFGYNLICSADEIEELDFYKIFDQSFLDIINKLLKKKIQIESLKKEINALESAAEDLKIKLKDLENE